MKIAQSKSCQPISPPWIPGTGVEHYSGARCELRGLGSTRDTAVSQPNCVTSGVDSHFLHQGIGHHFPEGNAAETKPIAILGKSVFGAARVEIRLIVLDKVEATHWLAAVGGKDVRGFPRCRDTSIETCQPAPDVTDFCAVPEAIPRG